MNKFDAFIQEEKFIEDMTIPYPGVANSSLRPTYTEKINQAAVDFKKLALSANSTNEAYLKAIRTGLKRFENTELIYDTEDKERVCHYFEELMDIVGLESSNGILNSFLYGLDPNDFEKQ